MSLSVVNFLNFLHLASFFNPIIIPPGSTFRRINAFENQQLINICGRSTNARRYPWVVSILLGGHNKHNGIIISPYHILTTGHSFTQFTNFDFVDVIQRRILVTACRAQGSRPFYEIFDRQVIYGSDCVLAQHQPFGNSFACNNPTVVHNRIRVVMFDADFGNGRCINGHDWAIIEVDQPIVFNDYVRPICLPVIDQPILFNLLVAGWGRYSAFAQNDPVLQEIPMRFDSQCIKPIGDTMPTNVPDTFCAKLINPFGPKICLGHSGAGIEQRDGNQRAILMGITTIVTSQCPPNELVRFTRVSIYLREICQFTGVCYTIG